MAEATHDYNNDDFIRLSNIYAAEMKCFLLALSSSALLPLHTMSYYHIHSYNHSLSCGLMAMQMDIQHMWPITTSVLFMGALAGIMAPAMPMLKGILAVGFAL